LKITVAGKNNSKRIFIDSKRFILRHGMPLDVPDDIGLRLINSGVAMLYDDGGPPEFAGKFSDKDCTIIIVTYSDMRDLPYAVKCAEEAAPRGKIIVYGNGATKEVADWVDAYPSGVNVPAHKSIAAAWNAAIKLAETRIVILLNDDAFLKRDGVARLIQPLQYDDVGATGATGGILSVSLDHVGTTLNSNEAHYIEGYCIAFRKKVWRELGGFDEEFIPAYCEDSDFGLRLKKAGYRLIVVPGTCAHVGSATFKPGNTLAEHSKIRLREKHKALPVPARSLRDQLGYDVCVQCHPAHKWIVDATPGVRFGNTGDLVVDLDGVYEVPESQGNFGCHPVLRMCNKAGVAPLNEHYLIVPPQHIIDKANNFMRKFDDGKINIATAIRAAHRPASNWSGEKFFQVMKGLPEYRFFLFDAEKNPPADVNGGHWQGFDKLPNVVNLTGATPDLFYLFALVSKCHVALTVDTLMSTLANAAGIPQVLLLAGLPPTSRKHPFGPECRVLGPDPKPPCWPCRARGACPNVHGSTNKVKDNTGKVIFEQRVGGGPHCLSNISPERVIKVLKALVKNSEPK